MESAADRLLTARVAERYALAQDTALDDLADRLVDALFDELSGTISEQDVSNALQQGGLSAEAVNSLAGDKQAGGFLKALGGLVSRGLWRLIVQPFISIGKLFSSQAFRTEIKVAFKRALRREFRATRHAVLVLERIALGQPVHPKERKAAMLQLLDVLVKVVFLYLTGPTIATMFSGGIWPALSRFMAPAVEIVAVLLDKPIRAAVAKLMAVGLPV